MAVTLETIRNCARSGLDEGADFYAIAIKYGVQVWEVVDWAISLKQGTLEAKYDSQRGSRLESPSVAKVDAAKIVFLHLPKTAGTTIVSHLEDGFALDRIAPIHLHEELENLSLKQDLMEYDFFSGHFFYSWIVKHTKLYGAARFMTFLREPVSRQISSYNHWMRETNRTYQVCSPLNMETNTQCMYLSPLDCRSGRYTVREHLEGAKQVLDGMFFVGIQDRLLESMDLLFDKLGRDRPSEYRSLNAAGAWQEKSIPDDLRREIERLNWADLELYEYGKELFAKEKELENRGRPTSINVKSGSLDRIDFNISDAMEGDGWHGREGGGQGQMWRWSGPSPKSHLDFDFNLNHKRKYELRVYLINAMTAEILRSVQVSLNDVPIFIKESRDEENRFYYCGEFFGGHVYNGSSKIRLTFKVIKTVSHNEVNPEVGDYRVCGIALARITVIPLLDEGCQNSGAGQQILPNMDLFVL